MDESDNSTMRQRIKNGKSVNKKSKTTSPKKGANDRFQNWIVCIVLGTFVLGIGIVLFLENQSLPAQFFKELGRECDDGTGKCIAIADMSEDFGKTWNRIMFFVNKSTFDFGEMMRKVGAESLLKCPKNYESALCAPDHGRLAMSYIATMGIMPFVVGALRHPTQMQQKSQSAMVVGLGGGTLDMFLHKKTPNLNITIYDLDPLVVKMAGKWFGTVEDSTRHTIVGDGLVAIEKAAENGEQFDLVALDACDMFQELVCPVPAFGTEKALRNIKAILKPTGAFLVNVIMRDADVAEQKRMLLRIFPTCLHTTFVTQLANVFVCLPVKVSASERAKLGKEWEKKREELAEEFEMGDKLKKYRISG